MARCLAWIFAPLLRTLIRSRMFYPLPHHRLAKTQISCAILPRLFWIGLFSFAVARLKLIRRRHALARAAQETGAMHPRAFSGSGFSTSRCSLKANIQASAQLSRPRNGCFAPHHRLAKTQISCAILPRPAANFLFYKSHKSYKSYKSYFYQATGCTPGGKQASAQLSRPRNGCFAPPPERSALCAPAQKTTLKSQTLLCDDDRRGAFANKSFLKRGAGKDFFSKKSFPANPVIRKKRYIISTH